MSGQAGEDGSASAWAVVGLIIAVLVGTSLCSKEPDRASVQSTNDALALNMDVTGPDAAPSGPLPLDGSAVERGGRQLRVVAALQLSGSPRIFSQNCYDALEKAFDWRQLDRCGGFDAQAARWAEQSLEVSSDEAEYFQSETAATRFLSSATANGLAGPDADVRWESVQALARKIPLPPTDPPAPSSEVAEPAVDNLGEAGPAATGVELLNFY